MDKKRSIETKYGLLRKGLGVDTSQPGDLINKSREIKDSKEVINSKQLTEKERVAIFGLV